MSLEECQCQMINYLRLSPREKGKSQFNFTVMLLYSITYAVMPFCGITYAVMPFYGITYAVMPFYGITYAVTPLCSITYAGMPLFKILIIISRNVGDKKVISMTCTLTAKARQKSISMTCTLDSQGQAPWGLGLGAWLYKSHPPPAQQAVLFLLSP